MTTTDVLYVWPFDAGIEPDHAELGGKCGSLVSMTTAGMPVPPGFAITTTAYNEFIASAGIEQDIHRYLASIDPEDTKAVDEVSQRIRDEIMSFQMPTRIHDATSVAYHALMEKCGGEVPVAVRSSATAEDLPDASFAGQQDTYLWLVGSSAVKEHIRRCWASLYTTRAIIYRLKNDIPNEGLGMAVAVQKMVNARVAGVAITMDPTNGDRSKITIDASYGVGEMVVSGLVTPDNIMLDKVTLVVVGEHIGDKHAELDPDPTTRSLVQREVPRERADVRCLTDDELKAVALMAKRCEKHYRCPQDIEWALDADLPDGENLLLLQSRPETIHSNKPKPEGIPAASAPNFSMSSITASMIGTSSAPTTPAWPVA
jgi:pyruvate,water dikinase